MLAGTIPLVYNRNDKWNVRINWRFVLICKKTSQRLQELSITSLWTILKQPVSIVFLLHILLYKFVITLCEHECAKQLYIKNQFRLA